MASDAVGIPGVIKGRVLPAQVWAVAGRTLPGIMARRSFISMAADTIGQPGMIHDCPFPAIGGVA